ncbi:CYTH domain-containing protein [Iodobacter sp. HSC-16F04]|uniref:CYTH domain-containing protein n=1 Tax=Iodobacter violaceini TaxID=3044271 RepID=A0ABX0KY44_9NEIS|nr:CYTH domain-containing protein [Iodobacter violacea]NHQ87132.1 CYTH domain-containing protein [Iodobacter violacea]
MATEIERKFLLSNEDWRKEVHQSSRIAQGYLSSDPDRVVRVRLRAEQGFITIKGKTAGIERLEFEYEIPFTDAEALLGLCPNVLDKTRHLIDFAGYIWEIDEFHGENTSLIIAELELPASDAAYTRPAWLGEEVSDDPRYFNSYLSEHPYSSW